MQPDLELIQTGAEAEAEAEAEEGDLSRTESADSTSSSASRRVVFAGPGFESGRSISSEGSWSGDETTPRDVRGVARGGSYRRHDSTGTCLYPSIALSWPALPALTTVTVSAAAFSIY